MVAIENFPGEKNMKSGLLTAIAVGGLLLAGPVSAQGVKIGILNDQSGVYADYGGRWSFEGFWRQRA
jgi:branched-chain amino acid transport system substrate-binding protein